MVLSLRRVRMLISARSVDALLVECEWCWHRSNNFRTTLIDPLGKTKAPSGFKLRCKSNLLSVDHIR